MRKGKLRQDEKRQVKKEQKENIRNKIKESKIYVFLVYVVIPIVITIGIFQLKRVGVNYMSSLKIEGVEVLNSSYSIERYYQPFISSMLIIIAIILSWCVVKVCDFFWDNNAVKFDLKFAKGIMFIISVCTIIATVITIIYSKADSFDYGRYGISVSNLEDTTKKMYIPLEIIPSFNSIGISSPSAPYLYTVAQITSYMMKYVGNNIGLIAAIIAAILIPLKVRIEFFDDKKNR